MNTSSHIASSARAEVYRANVKRALPAAISIALIAATSAAWYVILDIALSSVH